MLTRWWTDLLSQPGRSSAIALTLDGNVKDAASNPLPLLAGAAAAASAGDAAGAQRLHDQALVQARDTPTYYGDAWLALVASGAVATGQC
jgi:hypothetical protein